MLIHGVVKANKSAGILTILTMRTKIKRRVGELLSTRSDQTHPVETKETVIHWTQLKCRCQTLVPHRCEVNDFHNCSLVVSFKWLCPYDCWVLLVTILGYPCCYYHGWLLFLANPRSLVLLWLYYCWLLLLVAIIAGYHYCWLSSYFYSCWLL